MGSDGSILARPKQSVENALGIPRASNDINKGLSDLGNNVNREVSDFANRNKDTYMDIVTGGLAFAHRELIEKPEKANRQKIAQEQSATDKAISEAKDLEVKKELLTDRDKKRQAQRIRGASSTSRTILTTTPTTNTLGNSGGKTILGV